MRETMWRQPADLRRILADWEPVERAAARLRGRRLLLLGTGTSWHAANHATWFLRGAGVYAHAQQAMDVALYGPGAGRGDAAIVFSHRNTKRYTTEAAQRLRAEGAEVLVVGGIGSPGVDVETTEQERSSAFTASHLGALARAAQLAVLLGAQLGPLEAVPDAIEAVLAGPGLRVAPPERLVELAGAGPNQWTAAEGALKIREASYVASEGLAVEQLRHGPVVALDRRDALVLLDGGGSGTERVASLAAAAEAAGVAVYVAAERELGEQLSVFPLTAHVQRVALELAEALGTNPDDFRESEHAVWRSMPL